MLKFKAIFKDLIVKPLMINKIVPRSDFSEPSPSVRLLRYFVLVAAVAFCLAPINGAFANVVDSIVKKGVNNTSAGAASQKRIDKIADQIEAINGKYKRESKAVESLKDYNDRMKRTVAAQELGMQKLLRSIEDASLIERQIVPLMLRMISGLEKFVAADIPFKLEERNARIERIKGYLTNANISAAERFRQVLEAYSIEVDYGDAIAVYTDSLQVGSETITANILQVGRSGLYYQTLDGQRSGYWDRKANTWTALDSSHNEGINHAIRMTQGKESKDLMMLPIEAPEKL